MAESNSTPAQEGTLRMPAFDLPWSSFLSVETRAVLKRQAQDAEALSKTLPKAFEALATAQDALAFSESYDRHYYPPVIERLKARYPVAVQSERIAGVRVDTCTPDGGVSADNRQRVLINLHGGAFVVGKRWGAQLESIPIASVGKIKVVGVDYRMAPEHRFPAGSEDVAAVYRALLRDYSPENIGIYGCSAGAVLTGQSLAWFQKEGLPMPGAAGIFCAGTVAGAGDSTWISGAMLGTPGRAWPREDQVSYFSGADFNNPLAFPSLDPRTMSRFPPCLLLTSTRDQLMSAVIVTHAQLVKLGVQADLHVWEGLGHVFFYEPDLPESREVHDVIAHFFSKQLGRR